jgi:hypothetical protein
LEEQEREKRLERTKRCVETIVKENIKNNAKKKNAGNR